MGECGWGYVPYPIAEQSNESENKARCMPAMHGGGNDIGMRMERE